MQTNYYNTTLESVTEKHNIYNLSLVLCTYILRTATEQYHHG